jgi:hypothetical protein
VLVEPSFVQLSLQFADQRRSPPNEADEEILSVTVGPDFLSKMLEGVEEVLVRWILSFAPMFGMVYVNIPHEHNQLVL